MNTPESPRKTATSRADIERVARSIARRFDPEQVVLFGSHATGTPTPDSDVDLLVVMSMDVPRHERAASIRALFRPSPFPMDTLVFTPEEVEYWRGTVNHIITEAFESGEVLYERQE